MLHVGVSAAASHRARLTDWDDGLQTRVGQMRTDRQEPLFSLRWVSEQTTGGAGLGQGPLSLNP